MSANNTEVASTVWASANLIKGPFYLQELYWTMRSGNEWYTKPMLAPQQNFHAMLLVGGAVAERVYTCYCICFELRS